MEHYPGLDPDFEKKYNEVKPILDKYKETGYVDSKLEEVRQKKEAEAAAKDTKVNPFLDKEGNETAFSKEGLLNRNFGKGKVEDQNESLKEVDPLEKNVQVSGTEGRRILFSKEDIEKANQQMAELNNEHSVENVMKDTEKIADELKKEEWTLSVLQEGIRRTEEHLNNLKDPAILTES